MLRTTTLLSLTLALVLVGVGAPAHAFPTYPVPYGYWSFDRCDSNVAWDAAPTTPHNVNMLNGAYCSSWGRFGRSAYFDGSNDVAEVQSSSGINLDRLTVSAWVYPRDVSGSRTIVNKWYVMDSWGMFISYGNVEFAVAFPNGGWGDVVSVSYPISANTWTHVAGTYDGNWVCLYVNGDQKACQYRTGNIQDSTRPISIGSHPSWNAYWGYIDEVKLYDEALSEADIARLATPPGGLGIRGLHLYPSQWTWYSCGDSHCNAFKDDLGIIHDVGNLDAIKTTIFSMTNTDAGIWRPRQREKLTYLKSAVGNHVDWILRAWPTTTDCSPGSDYYQCGRLFAQNLADVFSHIQTNLKLNNVFIEVANEPNHSVETVFYDPNPWTTMGRYNDFFRGFYYGQQEIGYYFPLIYAGLASECDQNPCGADLWYKDYWVRYHIQNFATRVGVHVYWDSTDPYAWNGRLSRRGGLYYEQVADLLASGAYTPSVSAKGLMVTEFNFNRQTQGTSTQTQANEFCAWWQRADTYYSSGWWVDQTSLFITSDENGTWQYMYWISQDQLDDIRNCQ